jgi:hypothetical protein
MRKGKKEKPETRGITATGKSKYVVPEGEEYGLHLGQFIRHIIETDPDLGVVKIASSMGIVHTALIQKLLRPYFGNAYELLRLSHATGYNFFKPIQIILESQDHNLKQFFSEAEFNAKFRAIEKENKMLKNENEELRMLLTQLAAKIETMRKDDTKM